MFRQKNLAQAIALMGTITGAVAFAQEPTFGNLGFEGFLGGNVWEDSNENGFQGGRSAPERGVDDVAVTLTDDQGKPLQTTTTNKNGFYYFRGLKEGDYSVQFERPKNCTFTHKDRYNQYDPRFDYWDSDADKISGQGQRVRIDRDNRFDFSSDAGIIWDDVPAPRPPTLYPDAITLEMGETATVDVLKNDDIDGEIDQLLVNDRNFPGMVQVEDGVVMVNAGYEEGEFEIPYKVSVEGQVAIGSLWVTIERPPTLAVNDNVAAFVGDDITIDILANDRLSQAVESVRIVWTNLLGRVFVNRINNTLELRETYSTGNYAVEYEIVSADGTFSSAYVFITLEAQPTPVFSTPRIRQNFDRRSSIDASINTTNQVASRSTTGADVQASPNATQTFIPTTTATFNPVINIQNNPVNNNVNTSTNIVSSVNNNNLSNTSNNANNNTNNLNNSNDVKRVVTPIALDINHSGKVDRIQGEFSFDFSGKGKQQIVNEWFAPSEGILVDTRIETEVTGQHLFGDQGGLFVDGFAKLAMFDGNKNGWVEGVELNHLGIWTDTNSNAKVDSGELSSLANHKIVSLSTAHMNYLSEAKLANGQTMLSEDVWFSVAAPAAENSAMDAAELTTNKTRLPIVLSVLAMIFSGFTAVSLISRSKKSA